MVPTAWKNKKEDLKNEITQKTAIIIGYESCLMTQETSIEIKTLGEELKELHQAYYSLWSKIQKEMDRDDSTPDGEYDKEREEEFQVDCGLMEPRVIVKTKLMEWDDIREKEKQNELDRKEKERLDDLHRREREKDAERLKSVHLLIQQQIQHNKDKHYQELEQVMVALYVTFGTTEPFNSTSVHSSQSKKESSTETEKSGLLYPDENRASFSDASDGPEEDDDKKRIKEDKQKDVNFRLIQQWSNAEAQRQFNEKWEETQRLFDEKWKEFTRKDELMWRNLLLLQDEQFYEDRIHRMFTDYLEHPAVKALIEKNKTKIHDLKDSLGAKGEIFGTLLRPGSSLEKIEESHSNNSQLKEENQESHGAVEVIVGKPAVSKNLNIESANQFFSPPGRPATTLEELIDGVSTEEETPDFVPNHLSNQHHILTTKQETIPVSCDTSQPSSLEETAVTISEVPTLAVDYSNKQQNNPSESIRPAEPIEGASTVTQQVAPISETSDQHQHSSAEQTNIGCSEIQPSSFNVNSDAVSSLREQEVTSPDKLQAFPEIQLSSALSDSTAVEVIDEEIIPHFRTPSGKTTKPQVLKQHTALKRKFPERVTSILQLYYESSREGRGFESQLSLVKSFIQVLKYFSHQLKNSLEKKVLEESARIQQSVWDPGGQNKLGVHQLLLGTTTDGWRILPFKISPIQPVSSRCPIDVVDQKVEPYGTGSAGEYVGNIWSPKSD